MTGTRGLRGAALAIGGGVLLGAATPPAWFPGAEFVVLPALMVWYHLATASERPWWHGYLFGAAHLAWFSWSLRHVLLPAYVAVVLVGALYHLLANAVVRSVGRANWPWAFAIAIAGTFWLRAQMPEIHYPHGQPCHCLWQWPQLLGAVVVGGEPLANALLAALAAVALDWWRSWRTAALPFGTAVRRAVLTVGAGIALGGLGNWLNAATRNTAEAANAEPLRVSAIEPGFHPFDAYRERRSRELFEQRLLQPSRDELRREPAPDLLLWPESAVPDVLPIVQFEQGNARWQTPLPRAPGSRLVLGAGVVDAAGAETPAALAIDLGSSLVVGYHGKRRLVPGGEFVPFLAWLPAPAAATLRDAFAAALGGVPDQVPAPFLPPLRTAGGVPFGALLCYDNAFPEPAAEQVAAGARLLVVLSNEAWYRSGGELPQLAAMTVVRALETATPIVRCTQDGFSLAIDAGGRIAAALPIEPSPQAGARILRVEVQPGSGAVPPMASLRASTGPFAALGLALAVAHALWRWAKLRRARSTRSAPQLPADAGGRGGGS